MAPLDIDPEDEGTSLNASDDGRDTATAVPTLEMIRNSQQIHCAAILQRLNEDHRRTCKRFKLQEGTIYALPGVWDEHGSAQPIMLHDITLLIPYNDVALRELVVRYAHTHTPVFGAHNGRRKTEYLIRQRFYWVGIRPDVERIVSACTICKLAKATMSARRGALLTWTAEAVNHTVCYDHILLDSAYMIGKNGERGIATIYDVFAQYLVAYPITSQDHAYLLDLFVRNYICHHGAPRRILADSELKSGYWRGLMQAFSTRVQCVTAYHHRGNPAERANRTIQALLRTALFEADNIKNISANGLRNYQANDWPKLLPYAVASFNAHPVADSGVSAFQVKHGYEFRAPGDLLLLPDPTLDLPPDAATYVREKLKWIKTVHDRVGRALEEKRYTRALSETQRHFVHRIHVGDYVLRTLSVRQGKLSPRADGPFRVIAKLGGNRVKVQAVDGSILIAHESQLVRHSMSKVAFKPSTAQPVVVQNPLLGGEGDGQTKSLANELTIGDLIIYTLKKESGTFVGIVLGMSTKLLFLQNVADKRKKYMHNYDTPIEHRKLEPAYRYCEGGREYDTTALAPRRGFDPITSYEKRNEVHVLAKMRMEDYKGRLSSSVLRALRAQSA